MPQNGRVKTEMNWPLGDTGWDNISNADDISTADIGRGKFNAERAAERLVNLHQQWTSGVLHRFWAHHSRFTTGLLGTRIIFTLCICPLPLNRHHKSIDDCLEGKWENYHICSVQYFVQQLCTVQCTHIWIDLTVVCWLDTAFQWLYSVLQFVCVRFRFLGLFCVTVYLCMCFCCVRSRFFSTIPRDWIWRRTSPKWPSLCRVIIIIT